MALDVEAGREYEVVVGFRRLSKPWTFEPIGGIQGFQASWAPLVPTVDLAQYDAVMVSVERSYELEGESMDTEFALPDQQAILLQNVIRANPRTVVVVHTGGGVDMMPWADQANTILFAGHTGEIQGNAIAEIVYGVTNPSGHLPFTLDRNIAENPSYPSYNRVSDYLGPTAKTEMVYSEGVNYGYRGYQLSGATPLFPFGFGLSYTKFAFSDLTLSNATLQRGQEVEARVKVTNTGDVAGHAVPQLYVTGIAGGPRSLKGFAKVFLHPGESTTVTIPLNARSLAHFDATAKTWVTEAGSYRVEIGTDATRMVLNTALNVPDRSTESASDSNPLPPRWRQAVIVGNDQRY